MLAMPRSHSLRRTPSAAVGRLADDEAVGHVLHAAAAAAPSAARPALVCAIRIAAASGGGRSGSSSQEARQVAGEVIERAAGGDDIDKPKQRGAQLAVARGEVHRACVQRTQRIARAGGKRGRQL